ncbi:MAG: NAD(P)/FAD-dependent oxidoreductase [Geodermatophilaceae bacterium]
MRQDRPTVSVVGAGVAGLTAAYLLQRRYDVTIFEADDRLGGHAHTHDVPTPDGRVIPIDTGFIVHNERTYPNLLRLFGELGVATQQTEMSMSIRCEGCGLEYAGARGLPGLFAQRRTVANPRYLRLLAEITRFHRHARRLLAAYRPGDPDGVDAVTLGAFLALGGYSPYFVQHFMVPVVSAVWSAGADVSLRYPARYLFSFLDNHGMLGVAGSPTWRTVVGGSRSYVERAAKELTAVHTQTPVRSVRRTEHGVQIRDEADQVSTADSIVVATHPDQALALLADPTPAEREVLGAFEYSTNETLFHTDASILPRAAAARASWNYLMPACDMGGTERVTVSYWMNKLHQIDEPVDYVVSLNAADRIDPALVLDRMSYSHPTYTPESVAAQGRLPELNTERTAYAGAYHGWGFHEDGCAAGVRAAASLGLPW